MHRIITTTDQTLTAAPSWRRRRRPSKAELAWPVRAEDHASPAWSLYVQTQSNDSRQLSDETRTKSKARQGKARARQSSQRSVRRWIAPPARRCILPTTTTRRGGENHTPPFLQTLITPPKPRSRVLSRDHLGTLRASRFPPRDLVLTA